MYIQLCPRNKLDFVGVVTTTTSIKKMLPPNSIGGLRKILIDSYGLPSKTHNLIIGGMIAGDLKFHQEDKDII